jgi:uncharacterized protein (DUF2141 family)
MMRWTFAAGLAAAMAATFGPGGAGSLAAGVASQQMAAQQIAAQHADLKVDIANMRSDRGRVLACLTAQPAKFPKCRDDPYSMRLQVQARNHALTFRDVPPGRYAIALLHDENGNGKADRAVSMIPREGFGFSRDAKVRMGPPKFNEAAFDMGSAPREMTIRMRYML